ncbi:MAG: phasin family protein [candidate division Zixibacteria bacterium]|nr:phasin family protein [candidate division Zixibacteria bacterium]
MRVIKRYRNRRLYDTETSATITQAELAGIVKSGVDVKVVDTATRKDITMQVLGRVLLHEVRSWGDIQESKELFKEMISIGGEKSMSILKDTVLASIGAFHVTKDKAEKIVDELIKKGELAKSDRKKAIMELVDKAEKSTAALRDKVVKETGKVHQSVTKAVRDLKLVKQADLEKLEKKIDKLTKAVEALEKKLPTP